MKKRESEERIKKDSKMKRRTCVKVRYIIPSTGNDQELTHLLRGFITLTTCKVLYITDIHELPYLTFWCYFKSIMFKSITCYSKKTCGVKKETYYLRWIFRKCIVYKFLFNLRNSLTSKNDSSINPV